MSSPFDAPDARTPLEGERPPLASPLHDPHVIVTAGLLGIYGVFDCGFSTLLPVFGVISGLTDPTFNDSPAGPVVMGSVGLLEAACIGGIGLLFLGGTAGLLSGRKWGWAVALLASALWMSSPCCIPVGAYCLFALLRKRVRTAYGIG